MNKPADTQTQDAFPKDVFDLDHTSAWPTPEPLQEWLPKLIEPEPEPTLREWLFGLLKP